MPNDSATKMSVYSSPTSDWGALHLPSPRQDAVYYVASPSTSTFVPASTSESTLSNYTSFIAAPSPQTPPSSDDSEDTNSDTGGRTGRRAQYPCMYPTCERILTSPYTRQVHMRTHKPKVPKPFVCSMACGQAFTRQHDRRRHEVVLHGKKCEHVCARCKRFFSSEKMLQRHVCRGHREGTLQWPLSDSGT